MAKAPSNACVVMSLGPGQHIQDHEVRASGCHSLSYHQASKYLVLEWRRIKTKTHTDSKWLILFFGARFPLHQFDSFFKTN